MTENIVVSYEASIYSRDITYRNLNGETKTVSLHFALDPLQLMSIIADVPVRKSKSNDPRKKGQPEEISDSDQIKLIRDLASKAAGFKSDDGETWEPFEDFDNQLAGKAFLTKLTASDADRKEFAEQVIIAPFQAFVDFAKVEPSNSKDDVAELEGYLQNLKDVFTGKTKEPAKTETLAERRARLTRELAETPDED